MCLSEGHLVNTAVHFSLEFTNHTDREIHDRTQLQTNAFADLVLLEMSMIGQLVRFYKSPTEFISMIALSFVSFDTV